MADTPSPDTKVKNQVDGVLQDYLDQLLVVVAVPRLVQAKLLIKFLLLDEGQDVHSPAQERLAVTSAVPGSGGQRPIHVRIVVHA